jgi:hypothetical protein
MATQNNKGRTSHEGATPNDADHGSDSSVAHERGNSRRKQRERLPVAPVSKYRLKQLRAAESGTFGAALLAALGKAAR